MLVLVCRGTVLGGAVWIARGLGAFRCSAMCRGGPPMHFGVMIGGRFGCSLGAGDVVCSGRLAGFEACAPFRELAAALVGLVSSALLLARHARDATATRARGAGHDETAPPPGEGDGAVDEA